MFYELAPEVAGHLGPDSIMDTSRHPPIVHVLHYEFDGWSGDELIESFPCFIVTDNLKQLIERAKPTGCSFGSVNVSTSEEFEELYPGRNLPSFSWLMIGGVAGRDDFGISATNGLIVSERLLQVLKCGRLEHCDVIAV